MNTVEAINTTKEVIEKFNKINLLGDKEKEALNYLMDAASTQTDGNCPRCSQKLTSCKFNINGRCDILNNTYFDRACPFYKERGKKKNV